MNPTMTAVALMTRVRKSFSSIRRAIFEGDDLLNLPATTGKRNHTPKKRAVDEWPPRLQVCISFLVWEIHKPIAGDVGSNVGAGKMDNQCVEKIPLFVFCWMERRPPTVGRYPGAYLLRLG